MSTTSERYDRTSQVFHWGSAILLIFMTIQGLLMIRMGDTPLRTTVYNAHVAIGLLTLIITLARIVWLFRSKHPVPPPMPNWERIAFAWNHRLLYLVTLLLFSSGIGMLITSGMTPLPGAVVPSAIQDLPPRAGHDVMSKLLIALFPDACRWDRLLPDPRG
jgi:cytochrome b561